MTAAPAKLALLTWNVWFDDWCSLDRNLHIFEHCQALAPDVMCFQEATPRFLQMLRRHPLVDEYHISDETQACTEVKPYGALLLLRRSVWPQRPHFKKYRLSTFMDLSLFLSEVPFEGSIWTFSTVHLESLNNAELRETQLAEIAHVLHGPVSQGPKVLAGDFNFCRHRNFAEILAHRHGYSLGRSPSAEALHMQHPSRPDLENAMINRTLGSKFVDAWPALHPEEKGWTFDSEINTNLHQYEQMCYDRIVFADLPPEWVLSSIALEGTKPFLLQASSSTNESGKGQVHHQSLRDARNGQPVFMSDHFALHAVFDRIVENTESSPDELL